MLLKSTKCSTNCLKKLILPTNVDENFNNNFELKFPSLFKYDNEQKWLCVLFQNEVTSNENQNIYLFSL